MKKLLLSLGCIVFTVALLVCGYALYQHRPSRTVVTVNGHALSAGEIDQRARAFLEDVRLTEKLDIPKSREREALLYYRGLVAKLWVSTRILVLEALERNVQVAPNDEQEALKHLAQNLKRKNGMTPEDYFKQKGFISEELKRQDFKETILIGKLLSSTLTSRIKVTTEEINIRMDRATLQGKKVSRKQVIDRIRYEKYQHECLQFYKECFDKTKIISDEMPELENFEMSAMVVTPNRIPPGWRQQRLPAKPPVVAKPQPTAKVPAKPIESNIIAVTNRPNAKPVK